MLNRRTFLHHLSGIPLVLIPWKIPASPEPGIRLDQHAKLLLYSGWNTQNIGDQGHTPGTLRFLEQHFPEASVRLWLSKTDDELNAMMLRRFQNIEGIYQGSIDAQGKADNARLQKAFDEADLFIHNSGMHYNKFWNPSPILEACYRVKKALCLYGQSFDGFFAEDQEKMVRYLSHASAIYCRDVESYHYLRKIGVTSDILEFGPDGCFGIDLANEAKAEAFLARHKLQPKQFLSIVLRTNTPYFSKPKPEDLPEWDNGDKTQNPWEPSEADQKQTDLWVSKLREIITHWVEHTDQKVVLVPEVEKEIRYAKEYLYDPLPDKIKKKVVHKAEWWNMDEACSFFQKTHTLLALEPHSCIMALAHGTPALHYFSARHGLKAWMFRDIGLPEWLYDVDQEEAGTVIRALEDIHRDYDRAQAKVKRAMAFVEQRSQEMIGDLRQLVLA
jgi:polysaccharide pyruvyl transferase WcaK-like protein